MTIPHGQDSYLNFPENISTDKLVTEVQNGLGISGEITDYYTFYDSNNNEYYLSEILGYSMSYNNPAITECYINGSFNLISGNDNMVSKLDISRNNTALLIYKNKIENKNRLAYSYTYFNTHDIDIYLKRMN